MGVHGVVAVTTIIRKRKQREPIVVGSDNESKPPVKPSSWNTSTEPVEKKVGKKAMLEERLSPRNGKN